MAANYQLMFEKDYQKLLDKYDKKSEKYKQLKYEYELLQAQYKNKCKQVEQLDKEAYEKYSKIIDEKDKALIEKDKEIERLKSLLNLDGTNAGIPTSKTPFNKKKVVPNSREKSNKKIGGQLGHKKHKLEKFNDDEVTEYVEHELNICPNCNGKLVENGEIYKDELSFKVVTIKRRHIYKTYECPCCHKIIHEEIPQRLKEENQYGSEVQALALSLINEGNVSINKIRRIIRGISHNDIDLSEGYIAKLQKRASNKLIDFNNEVYNKLLKQDTLYWDDTVIMVNQKQACLRFYGTKKIALYKAHEKKNKEGLDKDGILNTLSRNTKVMHDHNKVNYNPEYSFTNIECNEHLKRDLQKCYDNTRHEWSLKLKDLIKKTQHDRKQYIENKKEVFDDEYLNNFDYEFNDIILKGIEENKNNKNCHYHQKELTLINRILDYKENYFMWLHNFDIPCDNNLSERGLRGVKSKMKISGQFQNIENAQYYANIKTYIETCYRNNVNPTNALIDLINDNPISLNDILKNE